MNFITVSLRSRPYLMVVANTSTSTSQRIKCLPTFSSRPSSSSSISASLKLLSLTRHFTARELRDAYFDAAKRCHPDTASLQTPRSSAAAAAAHTRTRTRTIPVDEDAQKAQASNSFLEITEAYEALQEYSANGRKDNGGLSKQYNEMDFITKTEEQYYREAVKETLGIDADVLEESKKCPMFRIWLKGGSHTAFHYNIFLMRHGGLAQMLPAKKAEQISEGAVRRRRKR